MLDLILKLITPALIMVALSVLFYLLKRKTGFIRLPYWSQQLIIGLVFGAASVLGSELGYNIGTAIINVRDAAPVAAGLLFGGPAGIIAGLIGAVERFFAVYWGASTYTQLACVISTALSGFYVALLRKNLFEYKRPNFIFGGIVSLVFEMFHMTMVFVTHLDNAEKAYSVVKAATIPMVAANAAAVMLACLLVSLCSRELHLREKRKKSILQKLQSKLLIAILIAYFITTFFVFALQTNSAYSQANNLLSVNIADTERDISATTDRELLMTTQSIKAEYETNPERDLSELAANFGVCEINIVNGEGYVYKSTNPAFLGFDMKSGEQSREFLVLNDTETEYVQDYRAIAYDSALSRKYAGVRLSKGGFVQVGHNAETFQKAIASDVVGTAVNRHVGNDGYVILADENFKIVSEFRGYTGKDLKSAGISIDAETMKEYERYRGKIFDEKAFYMFSEKEGFYIIGVFPESEAFAQRDASAYVNSYMEILIFAVLYYVLNKLIKRQVVDKVHDINKSLGKIIDGKLDTVVEVRSTEEFSNLSDDINQTVSTLNTYIKEAAARIDKDLALAQAIQHSALPNVFPAFPNLTQFDVYATMNTAKEVGGDFYDFYMVGENKFAFLVADVSGKGIPAAMFMMTSKTMIKNYAETGMAIDKVMTFANERLCEGNEAGMFVTAWFGILDIMSGHVDFVNAGHNPPLVMRKNGEYSYLKSKAGFVLAGIEGFKYKAQSVDLQPGDRIYLYTDGVTEATSAKKELYGEQRLLDYLNTNMSAGLKETLTGVKEDVDKFVDGEEQFDDITMLIVEFAGSGESNTLKERVFPAKDEELDNVIDFIQDEMTKSGCDMGLLNKIAIVTEEIFVNIAHYAYKGDDGDVKVGVAVENSKLTIRFQDKGIQFNPLAKDDPDVTLAAEDRNIGGLGIFMVKKMMDDVRYEYANGENVLTLVKNI